MRSYWQTTRQPVEGSTGCRMEKSLQEARYFSIRVRINSIVSF